MELKTITSPIFLLRYSNLVKKDENGKYGITMVFLKNTNISEMKTYIDSMVEHYFGKNANINTINYPLKEGKNKIYKKNPDGTSSGWVGMEDGMWYMHTTTQSELQFFDKMGCIIPKDQVESEFYDGCFCRAKLFLKKYDKNLPKIKLPSITAYLNGIQKVMDGERILKVKREPFEAVKNEEIKNSGIPENYVEMGDIPF